MNRLAHTIPIMLTTFLASCIDFPTSDYSSTDVTEEISTLQASHASRAQVYKELGPPTHVMVSQNTDIWIRTGSNFYMGLTGGWDTYPMEESQFTVVRYDQQDRIDFGQQAVGKRKGSVLLSLIEPSYRSDDRRIPRTVKVFVRLIQKDGIPFDCPSRFSITFAGFGSLGLPIGPDRSSESPPGYRCISDSVGGKWLVSDLPAGSVHLYFSHPKSASTEFFKHNYTHGYEMLPSPNTRSFYGGTFVIEVSSALQTVWNGRWLNTVLDIRNEPELARAFAATELVGKTFQTVIAMPVGSTLNLLWYGE